MSARGGKESDHSPKKPHPLSFLALGALKLDFSAESCFYHPKRQRIRVFQTPGDDFFLRGAVSQHKRGIWISGPPLSLPLALFFFRHLSFPNGLRAPEQLRPLCLLSQSKISLSSCLNPAETLHPDSNTSPQLLHSIIPCLPPFSLLL